MINLSENKELILYNPDSIEEKENKKDIQELAKNTLLIKSITKDINELLDIQGKELINIDNNNKESSIIMNDTAKDLKKAKKYFFSARLIKTTLITSLIGFCIGGPLGGFIGTSIGSGLVLTGISGSILGTVTFGGTTYGLMKSKANED